MLIDGLLTYLFDGQPHLLAAEMRTWLNSSRRFSSFATSFRNKIRKKMRVTQDQETLYDLCLELETAYLLLRERSLSLVYEPEQSGPGRSPDFAVTYTISITFMAEVTRLRTIQKRTSAGMSPGGTSSPPLEGERLADAVCSKLRQLSPQRSNVLIVGIDSSGLTHTDLQATMLRILQRAEGNDPGFWQRYGFRDRADFFRHYQRLSEVLIRSTRLQAGERVAVWVNPQAKRPLPGKVRTVLHRSHSLSFQYDPGS